MTSGNYMDSSASSLARSRRAVDPRPKSCQAAPSIYSTTSRALLGLWVRHYHNTILPTTQTHHNRGEGRLRFPIYINIPTLLIITELSKDAQMTSGREYDTPALPSTIRKGGHIGCK